MAGTEGTRAGKPQGRLVSQANETARQGGSFALLQAAGSLKLKEYLKVESVGISVWDKNLKLEFSPFLFLPVRVYVLL